LVGEQRSAPAGVVAGELPIELAAPPIATPEASPTPFEEETEVATPEVQVVEVPAAPTVHTANPPAATQPEAVPVVEEPAATAAGAAPGERVFIIEADLGDVVLNLGYIVARHENPFAEINGIDVYLGSEIEGFVVESIEADRVVLRDDEGLLVLRVP
jgi:hypothetical protein